MTPRTRAQGGVLVLVLGALVGCATPRPVLDLAGKTSANVSFVTTQLDLLAQDSRRVADARMANLVRLQGDVAQVRMRHEMDLEVLRKVEPSRVALLDELRQFTEKVIELHAQAARAAAELRTRIQGTQEALAVPARDLRAVAAGLAGLAKEETALARAQFLAGFVKEVAKEVDARRKDTEKALDDARRGVDKNASKPAEGKE